MPVFSTLIVLVVICSVAFNLLTLSRILAYNKKYRFPELKYTKLFRIITKEYLYAGHLLFTIAHALFAIWFIWTL